MQKLANQYQEECKDASQSVKVGIATNDREKFQIYRLRYQVYVEEMGRQVISADHKNRLLTDELDTWGILVYVKVGSEVIGTVRLNIGAAEVFSPELVRTLLMDKFKFCKKAGGGHNLGFSSKLVVAPAYRKSQTAYLAVAQLYEIYRDYRVQFSFAGCNPYLISLYEQMGFRRFGANFTVPEYGCMVPLVWLMEDIDHFRDVRSPFYRNARRRENDSAATRWFQKEFPDAARFINSRLVKEDELWSMLKRKFHRSPEQAIPVLAGLTEEEAKKFVHMGIMHMCKKGERLMSPGDISHELNILLSGMVIQSGASSDMGSGALTVSPGGIFGQAALAAMQKQAVHVTAVTDAEYLLIPGTAFEKFRHNYPAVADKIMRNTQADKSRQGGIKSSIFS